MAIILKPENVAKLVFFVPGEKVMLDVDLAKLYGVTTKALNQAMRRNKTRFPEDFAFRLSREEFDSMRSQIVTTSRDAAGWTAPAREWSEPGGRDIDHTTRGARVREREAIESTLSELVAW